MAITKIININEVKDRHPPRHLETALEYIQNGDKTEEKILVGSINCLPETAYEQMLDIKQIFGKTSKRQGYHITMLRISGIIRGAI
ncbi:MAG: relaxase/mobilization nuclease domain-containing protein [Anaerocolumna sp.]